MATTMEIVRGISQVMANSYDGALDEKGEPIKVGLKREEGHPIHDSRVMDGFKVSFHGNKLCIHYHSEIKLKEVYANGFESGLEQMIEDIASFIKKEYRKVTGSSLTLTKDGEMDAIVQNTSRIRTFVQAKCFYALGGLDDSTEGINDPSEDRLEDNFRKFLEQDAGDKKAKNDKRKAPTPGQPVYAGKGKVHARKDVNSTYKAE
jgi:hypothetical protein|tara:strand:+ start:1540 stop:2154 length:615 start_codon:yes stop_codon:yes gene_type:complete